MYLFIYENLLTIKMVLKSNKKEWIICILDSGETDYMRKNKVGFQLDSIYNENTRWIKHLNVNITKSVKESVGIEKHLPAVKWIQGPVLCEKNINKKIYQPLTSYKKKKKGWAQTKKKLEIRLVKKQ